MSKQNNNKYWILKECSKDDSAVLDAIPLDRAEKFRLFKNEHVKELYPENTRMGFSDNYPDKTKLYDFVDNVLNLLIVSENVKKLFDELGIGQVEYLPLTLLDHQDNVAGENYYIVNLLVSQPIIDMENSKYKMGHIDKTQIKRIKKLHLATDAVDPEIKLFRAESKMNLYFITDEVLAAMNTAGITGVQTIEAEGWNGLEIFL